MTGSLTHGAQQQLLQIVSELQTELEQLQPLLKQMHLLSSNAVSSAARAGSEGDAFRVLTQAIQQLGQDIKNDVQQAQKKLVEITHEQDTTALKRMARQLNNALSELPVAIRKGEYLAVYASVEAAHAEMHGESFDSVAIMLKQLINDLRRQVAQQQEKMTKLMEIH